MPMLKEPWKKYNKFRPVKLLDRQWPSKTIKKAPRWMSADLHHGNQDSEEKLKYLQMLIDLGYKEIEVPPPSASQTDFDFTRRLIETPGIVSEDVWLQVPSSCNEDAIRRSVEAARGANKVIIYIYLTSEHFRDDLSIHSLDQCVGVAAHYTMLVRSLTKDNPEQRGTQWAFGFSPEVYPDTEPDDILGVCETVKATWEPTIQNPIIFNLPAAVEMLTPNIYADHIEYFCRYISEREKVVVSLRPCNDRGSAVASAELGQMAGADRIEGCLFGNGESTGNVDLVILALNLYTQGVDPKVDFSDINSVIEVVERYNDNPVHQRAPYGGSLVVCAFSGSHQDAIKKAGVGVTGTQTAGNKSEEGHWVVPYLPFDPKDIGRTYEAVIRVNSQSGKGGAAWVILRHLQFDLPRGLQVAFFNLVQENADKIGKELETHEITELFENAYHIKSNPRFQLLDYTVQPDRSMSPAPPEPGKTADIQNMPRVFDGVLKVDGHEVHLHGRGNGPISALADALKVMGVTLDVKDYKEHSIGTGRGVRAASYLQCTATGSNQMFWGVGVHQDVVQSSLNALLSAASNFASSRPGIPKMDTDLAISMQNVHSLNGLEGGKGPHTIISSLEIQVQEP